jgi:hypothetical protein
MSFQDKYLQCSHCGVTFTFSAEEQDFSQSRGYICDPKRCPSCHSVKKTERFGDGDYSYRSRSWQRMFHLNLHQLLGDPNSN